MRAERDNKIEATLAEFFTAGDERDTLIAQLAALENTMGARVTSLFELGETATRIADLVDLTPKELKRLRGLVVPVPAVNSVPDVG
ncbi:hypothetical protein D6T64_04455 [Cryobacterium melibiosiphilum]|uniref:Uncharacterized protein n=1 Tax=Cryobacterium melibiosiphilum TaxID=995039 RepID=A0A3A5MR30_9MICO|nr:hypothetical protein D6T64_04455 [Cryobacterium melibiosiphilum]